MSLVDNFRKIGTLKFKTNSQNTNIVFDTNGITKENIEILKEKLKDGGVDMSKVDFIDSSKIKIQKY